MSDDSPQASQWSDIQALLDEALALPSEARGAWLRALPPEYDTLREILRRLLESRAHVDGVAFSATTAHDPAGSRPTDPIVSPGDLVGPYRVLRELGSGGMGAVWLAERADGQLRRKFALKLPRLIWAPDLAARVARERDILVSLEHPNIARLYDAGVDALGRPFLALEYVEGQRIDAYCDEHRLGLRERVQLLKQIVDAVQYAHTQLVIHRDLKPANVLVNSRGKAILLDFGIASLLGDTSGSDVDPVAMTVSRALTPRFASPEQLQGIRLSLTSDVYSLGVMMYDLLVGTTPYRTRNPTRGEFERAVVEGDIRVPSQAELTADIAARRGTTSTRLSRQLGGDLDAIVTKAMQLSPQDRYTTVEAMGADIERWLTGHPVLAKPPSRIDRWVKFTQRNPVSVGLGTLAGLLITVSTAIAVTQSLQARAESRRANATNTFLLEMFGYANPELHGGRDITARELLIEGEKRVSTTLKDQPDVQAAVLGAIADTWIRLGNYEKTASLAARRLSALKISGETIEIQRAVIDLAHVLISQEKYSEATEVLDGLKTTGPIRTNELSADYLWIRGWISLEKKDINAALNQFEQSFFASTEAERHPERVRALYGKVQCYINQKNSQAAIKEFIDAFEILEKEVSDPGENLRRKFELISSLYALGEYRVGWPHIKDLIKESEKLYGKYSASQHQLRQEWIKWSSQMGLLEEVVEWIEGSRYKIDGVPTASTNEEDLLQILLEARVFALRRDFEGASKRLELVKRRLRAADEYSTIAYFQIDSEIEIRRGRLRESFNSLRKLGELNETGKLSEIDRMYLFWNKGLAELRSGSRTQAKESLLVAEKIANENFGSEHPRSKLIFFARLLTMDREKISHNEVVKARNSLDELADKFSPAHPLVVNIWRIVTALQTNGPRQEKWEDLRNLEVF